MSITRILALAAFVAFASGCSGIGEGSKLERIEIVQDLAAFLGGQATTEAKAYTCVSTPLTLIGTFTKGDRGNFASRARWTSLNPDVVRVTNRNEPVGDGSGEVYLFGGLLLPQSAGSTTVVAEYLGMRAEVPVTVALSTDVRITPAVARLAPGSFVEYTVRAKLDGVETDITDRATLSFVTPNDAVAIAGIEAQLKTVRAVAADPDPLTLTADFGVPCTGQIPQATVNVTEIPPNGLVLSAEDAVGLRDGNLAEPTAELLSLKVRFGDQNDDGDSLDPGEFQSLENQALFRADLDGDGNCELLLEGTATETAKVSLGSLISGLNSLTAVQDSDTDDETGIPICAGFGSRSDTDGAGPLVADNGVLSNTLFVNVIDSTLASMSLSTRDPCVDPANTECVPLTLPSDPEAGVVESGKLLKIDALGTFVKNGYQQDISKSVSWASSNEALARVVAGVTPAAGVLVTNTDFDTVPGCEDASSCPLTVTATWNGGTSDTTDDRMATIDLTVLRSASDE